MNCTDFERELQQLLDDRRQELPPPLEAHAAQCPACRTFWRAQQKLIEATQSWPNDSVPVRLTDRVLAALRNGDHSTAAMVRPAALPSTRHSQRNGSWAAVCSTAALLMLAVILVRSPRRGEINGPATLTEAPHIATTMPDVPVTQALAGLLQEVRTEYAEFSQETSHVLEGIGELPVSASLLPTISPNGQTPSPAPAGSSSWFRMAQPVSDRVGQAFDFLRDAVPGETPQSS